MRFGLFLLLPVLPACASASSTSSPPDTAVAPRPGCQVANAGPVIGYSYRREPQADPGGGPIADGVFDLVEIVRHTMNQGAWSSNMAPAFRWSLMFRTLETSSNHTSGVLDSATEIPPSVACGGGRFATFQTDLRLEGGPKGIEAVGYTADGDTLRLLVPDGDGGDPVTYVFRRRS